ncbi:hypothetical protein D1O30_06890 [Methylocystis hirsuta]|uniref:Uncharacterized protein n=2 Tax=Methylocystis hirsuta TaxID=369798 RepID=A0A3M9XMZ3_9HYPH|nr:hypothetical protein D1O30_06890 [Methylocystis hirsuta]
MLRALAVNAMTPQDGDLDVVTMAGDKVFDSMLDPAQFTESKSDLPAVLVYTDEDDTQNVSRATSNGPYIRNVTLRVEVVIGSFDSQVKTGSSVFLVPMTDPQLELRLDLFEQQVRWALLGYQNRPATNAFKKYVVQVQSISSHVQRDENSNNKLAARVLLFKCRINDDCPPPWGFATDPQPHVKKLTEDDFVALSPWLRPMLVAMQASPSMAGVVGALGGQDIPQTYARLLKRVGVDVDAIDPANPNLLAAMNKTQGPDGRVEFRAMWSPSQSTQ